jgi:2-polyprenyl-3-methyl-5-hydroxy-6-metoxy-1,4-benzoquinol methylase
VKWTFASVPTREVARWWDQQPCNVKHSDASPGSVKFTRDVRDKVRRAEPHRVEFMQLERWKGKCVVEIGCGIGTEALDFARAGARVFACDLSIESLRIATTRAYSEHLQGQVKWIHWNAEQELHHELRRRKADLIYSFGVLHHTPNPDTALRHLRQMAGPKTELRIMLYNRWSTKGLRLGLTDRKIAKGSEARADSPVTYAFTKRRARTLLRKTGWQVKSIHVDHIFMYDVDAYRRGEFVLAFPWRHLPAWVRDQIKRLVGWHLLIVAEPRNRS